MTGALAELLGLTQTLLWQGFVTFLRVGPALSLLPAFGEQSVPMRVRLALALAFTAIAAPAVAPVPNDPPEGLVWLLLAETVNGVVIGIGIHPAKQPMFTGDERTAMLADETKPIVKRLGTEILIETFDDLAVSAAARASATVIFRGLRDGTDLDYEMQMAGMNAAMAPAIQTVFVAAAPEVRHIAANLVRQIAAMGGDVRPFVSAKVAKRLAGKAKRR